jgi:hypothetical protein
LLPAGRAESVSPHMSDEMGAVVVGIVDVLVDADVLDVLSHPRLESGHGWHCHDLPPAICDPTPIMLHSRRLQ